MRSKSDIGKGMFKGKTVPDNLLVYLGKGRRTVDGFKGKDIKLQGGRCHEKGLSR